MNKKIVLAIAVICGISFFSTSAYPVTGEEALAKFRARMSSIGKLAGTITWTSGEGSSMSGSFKYMAPDKIIVKFTNPSGKIIVSNGRKLWVYNQSSSICGVQDLAGGTSSGGIAGVVAGYNAIVTSQGPDGYTLKLKDSTKNYSEIILRLDSTFFLKKAVFKEKSGDSFSFTLSGLNFSPGVMPSHFHFNVPPNAQTVKNPLNIK